MAAEDKRSRQEKTLVPDNGRIASSGLSQEAAVPFYRVLTAGSLLIKMKSIFVNR
jgi:hypothetical protein